MVPDLFLLGLIAHVSILAYEQVLVLAAGVGQTDLSSILSTQTESQDGITQGHLYLR